MVPYCISMVTCTSIVGYFYVHYTPCTGNSHFCGLDVREHGGGITLVVGARLRLPWPVGFSRTSGPQRPVGFSRASGSIAFYGVITHLYQQEFTTA